MEYTLCYNMEVHNLIKKYQNLKVFYKMEDDLNFSTYWKMTFTL